MAESDERLRRQVIQRLESLERAGVAQLRKAPRAAPSVAAPMSMRVPPSPPAPLPQGERGDGCPATLPRGEGGDESARSSAATNLSPPAPASPSPAMPPEVGLEIIRLEVAGCTRCGELASQRTQTVFGVGNIRPRLVFLGEAPGADEDAQGEPFVGRAGQLLTKIIEA